MVRSSHSFLKSAILSTLENYYTFYNFEVSFKDLAELGKIRCLNGQEGQAFLNSLVFIPFIRRETEIRVSKDRTLFNCNHCISSSQL